MLDMIRVCGIGLTENLDGDVLLDDAEYLIGNYPADSRFSEIKIINRLTFMLKELYIIKNDSVLNV